MAKYSISSFLRLTNPTKKALWDFRKHQLLQKQPVKEHQISSYSGKNFVTFLPSWRFLSGLRMPWAACAYIFLFSNSRMPGLSKQEEHSEKIISSPNSTYISCRLDFINRNRRRGCVNFETAVTTRPFRIGNTRFELSHHSSTILHKCFTWLRRMVRSGCDDAFTLKPNRISHSNN